MEDRILREGRPRLMARPSKYSPEFRKRSVRIARESERPIAAVARDLGIHHETLTGPHSSVHFLSLIHI